MFASKVELGGLEYDTSQQTWGFDPMLFWCWADVEDGGPTLKQLWAIVSCLLGWALINVFFCCGGAECVSLLVTAISICVSIEIGRKRWRHLYNSMHFHAYTVFFQKFWFHKIQINRFIKQRPNRYRTHGHLYPYYHITDHHSVQCVLYWQICKQSKHSVIFI